MLVRPQAINRVNEKRSLFGSKTMKVIDSFFSHPDYNGNTTKISEYATWAIRDNGPAVWGTPTPMNIKGPPGSKGFKVCLRFIADTSIVLTSF
jgi:hypothetical protein